MQIDSQRRKPPVLLFQKVFLDDVNIRILSYAFYVFEIFQKASWVAFDGFPAVISKPKLVFYFLNKFPDLHDYLNFVTIKALDCPQENITISSHNQQISNIINP